MPWYGWVLLACLVIGPFDALYLYIRAGRRREALKRGSKDDPEAGPSLEEALEGYYFYATGVSTHAFFSGDERVCALSRAALPGQPASISAEGVDWILFRERESNGVFAVLDRATGAQVAEVEPWPDGAGFSLRASEGSLEERIGTDAITCTLDGRTVVRIEQAFDAQRVREMYGDFFPRRCVARCAAELPPTLRTLALCAPFAGIADLGIWE